MIMILRKNIIYVDFSFHKIKKLTYEGTFFPIIFDQDKIRPPKTIKYQLGLWKTIEDEEWSNSVLFLSRSLEQNSFAQHYKFLTNGFVI